MKKTPARKKRVVRKTQRFPNKLFFFAFLGLVLAIGIVVIHVQHTVLAQNQKSLRTIPQLHARPVCGIPARGFARCHAHVVTNANETPLGSSTPSSSSMGPVQFHTAYNLPCTPGGSTQSICSAPTTFGPQMIAIVDAYNDPTVENDLNVYSAHYGLPSCTKANGCLTVVNQNGGSTLPSTDGNWALEISLDVQTAHTICQTCKILLVEASSSSMSNLATAVNTAAALGATAISNSYGASEFLGETSYDSYYNHPGIAVTVSAGDNGYGAEYPAAANTVVAVGGTTLQLYTDNTYAGESTWGSTGSGCSSYESANSWQTNLPNWSQTACGSKRGIGDISADADPSTGAAVYDSTSYNGSTGWWQVGGTSLSSPLIASIYALTGVPANTAAASLLYTSFNSSNSHDITTGKNGSCTTSMCIATTGYDGPTGLGSPNGILGFVLATATSPTNTPTPTATPTATPTPSNVDTQPPTVTITNPVDGSTVLRFSRVTISASASDNVGVKQVQFYINNTLMTTDITAPYSYSWRVNGKKGTVYIIKAVASDAAGNQSSNTITVTSR